MFEGLEADKQERASERGPSRRRSPHRSAASASTMGLVTVFDVKGVEGWSQLENQAGNTRHFHMHSPPGTLGHAKVHNQKPTQGERGRAGAFHIV